MKAYNLNTAQQHRESVTELYLHHCGLRDVPPIVFRCPRLQHLEITENELREIPLELMKLSNLRVLNLSGNHIETLPDNWSALSNLQQLDLCDNELELLPPAFFSLELLETLRLAGNRLRSLPEEIGYLRHLKELDVSDNELSALPVSLSMLGRLREFTACRNGLRRLPKALGNLSKLERLEIAGNRLRKLPPSLFSTMEHLSRLDLSGNRLREIPSSIGHCRHLAHLSAAGNKLKSLPPEIGRLEWLRRLDLSKNKLSMLPEEMGGCRFLRRLNLSENDLSALPPAIEHLRHLEYLSLTRNCLGDLPKLPPGLRVLNLAHNSMKQIPLSVPELTTLRELDLGYNRLLRLPETLHQLANLQHLRLSGNEIAAWQDTVLKLDSLDSLHGLTSGRDKRRLLRFLKACRRQRTSLVIRPALFSCYQGKPAMLEPLSLGQLVEALRFPIKEVRLSVRRHIINRRGVSLSSKPLKTGARLACIGKVHFDAEDLSARLMQQGVSMVNIRENPDFVVIGDRPSATTVLGPQQVFLSEVQLNDFLDRSEQRYLAGAIDGDKMARVRQLLLHEKPNNVRLAVQLMKGGGVPEALLTDLFFVWKRMEPGKLKRELRELLELNLSERDRLVLSLRRSLSENISAKQLKDNIRKFTDGTVLEASRLKALCGVESEERK